MLTPPEQKRLQDLTLEVADVFSRYCGRDLLQSPPRLAAFLQAIALPLREIYSLLFQQEIE